MRTDRKKNPFFSKPHFEKQIFVSHFSFRSQKLTNWQLFYTFFLIECMYSTINNSCTILDIFDRFKKFLYRLKWGTAKFILLQPYSIAGTCNILHDKIRLKISEILKKSSFQSTWVSIWTSFYKRSRHNEDPLRVGR